MTFKDLGRRSSAPLSGIRSLSLAASVQTVCETDAVGCDGVRITRHHLGRLHLTSEEAWLMNSLSFS